MCLGDNGFYFLPEAEPCDDISGNTTGHSKSTVLSGTKEKTSDEAASTSSVSTLAENLVCVVCVCVRAWCLCVVL